ncbi:MAG: amidohydrolase 2 [uncultured Chloroflexi bacterium]|uniref:Amidohydrolase 2 n=1 Tax=uncultured Chloroflexota bacterium TaxID=166587 RepID=A0A6J4HZI1_9CHLR|nr:MAG: amidohydrolase 2 [uncultured Chloroflexota bacterium]
MTTTTAPSLAASTTTQAPPTLIDCDIHNVVPNTTALFPYLSEHWREHITNTLFKGPTDTAYPRKAPTTACTGSVPPGGGPAGSSLEHLRAQLLDPLHVALGILCCTYEVDSIHNPDAAVVLARAVNDWQIAEWLDKEPRLRASIVVPSQIPHLAAQEIDRVGDHPGFVQVFLPVRSHHPYGSRLYHPLWEAVARHNLVGGIHFGGAPGNPPTPSGWPSYYLEEYAGMAQVFQSQLVSLITEGVFDQFPSLRVALIEAGFTWLPSFMWRFDKEWRNLRRLVPWVKRAPSAYIREHVRFTLQPLDAPPEPRHLLQVLDQIGSDDVLLYSSDYPHRHDGDPEQALFPHLPPQLVQKIRAGNARAFYPRLTGLS